MSGTRSCFLESSGENQIVPGFDFYVNGVILPIYILLSLSLFPIISCFEIIHVDAYD